jgi:hypothetical protein
MFLGRWIVIPRTGGYEIEGLTNIMKNLVSKICVRAVIRTEHLPIRIQSFTNIQTNIVVPVVMFLRWNWDDCQYTCVTRPLDKDRLPSLTSTNVYNNCAVLTAYQTKMSSRLVYSFFHGFSKKIQKKSVIHAWTTNISNLTAWILFKILTLCVWQC